MQANREAADDKRQSDTTKLQILHFLKVLGFAKPDAKRLSTDPLRKFAERNERHLWPHKAIVSKNDKEMDAIIESLKQVYSANESVEWSSNLQTRIPGRYVMKTLRSFTQFDVAAQQEPRVDSVPGASQESRAFRSLFAEEDEPEEDPGDDY